MILTYISSLVFIILVPAVVALHFIRRHRTRIAVASTFLWEEVRRSYKRRFFLQTLLRSLPLLLQILAVLLLVLALTDPLLRRRGGRIDDTVTIVIDTSASMKTKLPDSTRFDRALSAARGLIQDLEERTAVAIVSGATVPVVSGPYTSDRFELRNHLRSLTPTDEPGNTQLLLATAAGLLPPEGRHRIVLISDGAFDLDRPELFKELPIDYIGVGFDAKNIGIVAFEARKPVNRKHDYEILAILNNYSDEPYTGTLRLTGESEAIVETEVSLAPFGSETIVFPIDTLQARRVKAAITPGDTFEVDDIAYAVFGDGDAMQVHLVTEGNFFLEQLLLSYPNVEVSTDTEAVETSQYDIVVFDRKIPPLDFSGNAIIIGAVDPASLIGWGGIRENPLITGWEYGHPIIESVDISGFTIYRSIEIPKDDPALRSVVHSGDNTLLYTVTDEDRRVVGISFDISESDLPLRIAFPVLFSNILSWLDPQGDVNEQLRTGDVYRTRAEDVIIVSPEGQVRTGAVLETTGFYYAESQGVLCSFAVNLFDAVESHIMPRFEPDIDEDPSDDASDEETVSYRSIYLALVCAALLILLGEWIAWVRRRAP